MLFRKLFNENIWKKGCKSDFTRQNGLATSCIGTFSEKSFLFLASAQLCHVEKKNLKEKNYIDKVLINHRNVGKKGHRV